MPRTTGSAAHHLRVATLIAIVIANLALLGTMAQFVASAQGTKEVYTFSCCTGGFGTVNYHLSETVRLDWKTTPKRSTVGPARTVVLSASASGPFPTVGAADKAFKSAHPSGRTNFAAASLDASDEKGTGPVSLLHIPASAGARFSLLTTKVVKGRASSLGGSIFSVRP
jgi:hypothetical protein